MAARTTGQRKSPQASRKNRSFLDSFGSDKARREAIKLLKEAMAKSRVRERATAIRRTQTQTNVEPKGALRHTQKSTQSKAARRLSGIRPRT